MATGRVPTTANSPLTAKGDLFGYSTTQARVAVGSDGETLVADSSATTGLRWQGNFAAGKNKIINGDFNIWQRGTSFTTGGYAADRWTIAFNGTGTLVTISQQSFTAGTAPVSGYESPFFLRYNVTTAGTGNNTHLIEQRIEDVRTFANQTVTLSFWAKADSVRNVTPNIRQNFGSGGSAEVYTSGSAISLTTSWARYSQTFSVPSISGKTIGSGNFLGLYFAMPNNVTMTFDYWGVQLEAGNTATAFQTATGTLAGELAACQRYYFRSSSPTVYGPHGNGQCYASTAATILVVHPVQLRTNPSSIDFATVVVNDGAANYAVTALTIDNSTTHKTTLNASVASGLTQYRPCLLLNNNSTAGYVGLNAEL